MKKNEKKQSLVKRISKTKENPSKIIKNTNNSVNPICKIEKEKEKEKENYNSNELNEIELDSYLNLNHLNSLNSINIIRKRKFESNTITSNTNTNTNKINLTTSLLESNLMQKKPNKKCFSNYFSLNSLINKSKEYLNSNFRKRKFDNSRNETSIDNEKLFSILESGRNQTFNVEKNEAKFGENDKRKQEKKEMQENSPFIPFKSINSLREMNTLKTIKTIKTYIAKTRTKRALNNNSNNTINRINSLSPEFTTKKTPSLSLGSKSKNHSQETLIAQQRQKSNFNSESNSKKMNFFPQKPKITIIKKSNNQKITGKSESKKQNNLNLYLKKPSKNQVNSNILSIKNKNNLNIKDRNSKITSNKILKIFNKVSSSELFNFCGRKDKETEKSKYSNNFNLNKEKLEKSKSNKIFFLNFLSKNSSVESFTEVIPKNINKIQNKKISKEKTQKTSKDKVGVVNKTNKTNKAIFSLGIRDLNQKKYKINLNNNNNEKFKLLQVNPNENKHNNEKKTKNINKVFYNKEKLLYKSTATSTINQIKVHHSPAALSTISHNCGIKNEKNENCLKINSLIKINKDRHPMPEKKYTEKIINNQECFSIFPVKKVLKEKKAFFNFNLNNFCEIEDSSKKSKSTNSKKSSLSKKNFNSNINEKSFLITNTIYTNTMNSYDTMLKELNSSSYKKLKTQLSKIKQNETVKEKISIYNTIHSFSLSKVSKSSMKIYKEDRPLKIEDYFKIKKKKEIRILNKSKSFPNKDSILHTSYNDCVKEEILKNEITKNRIEKNETESKSTRYLTSLGIDNKAASKSIQSRLVNSNNTNFKPKHPKSPDSKIKDKMNLKFPLTTTSSISIVKNEKLQFKISRKSNKNIIKNVKKHIFKLNTNQLKFDFKDLISKKPNKSNANLNLTEISNIPINANNNSTINVFSNIIQQNFLEVAENSSLKKSFSACRVEQEEKKLENKISNKKKKKILQNKINIKLKIKANKYSLKDIIKIRKKKTKTHFKSFSSDLYFKTRENQDKKNEKSKSRRFFSMFDFKSIYLFSK